MCFGQILPSQTVAHGPLPVSTTLVRGFMFGRETTHRVCPAIGRLYHA
jgi:hypothetical protein